MAVNELNSSLNVFIMQKLHIGIVASLVPVHPAPAVYKQYI